MSEPAPAIIIHCPSCGSPVKLPATECPHCRANLRTGERPELYVPIWRRKKTKAILIISVIALPFLAWTYASSVAEDGVWNWIKFRLGLNDLTEVRNMWEDFDKEKFDRSVKSGSSSWLQISTKRGLGQESRPETEEEKNLPEDQRLMRRDDRQYFASTLTTASPSPELTLKDNWYSLFKGEWDVAWIEKSGSNNDRATPGEWVFSWIDGGKAVQDVLTVPYRWRSPESDFSPMAVTSVRTFNEKIGQWEGFHLSDGRLIYFRVAKPERGGGQLMEHFTPEGGPLTVWVFSDISASSFIVKISESLDKGSTYRPKAELWAKKRVPALP